MKSENYFRKWATSGQTSKELWNNLKKNRSMFSDQIVKYFGIVANTVKAKKIYVGTG